MGSKKPSFIDSVVGIKVKLAALWVAVMIMYVYADIRAFFDPAFIRQLLEGGFSELGIDTSQAVLIGIVLMTPPTLMIFLALSLKAGGDRAVNIIAGTFYILVTIVTQFGIVAKSNMNYIFSGLVEISLLSTIVWLSIKWPRE